jgi:Icc-related predicted phosphoesterase
MNALAFGDLHGQIRGMYAAAQEWEQANGTPVEVIIQVGDFGIYPAPERQPADKQEQYGPGEYAALVAEGWSAPIPTYFCKGNNEDFAALSGLLLPDLHFMPDGTVQQFGDTKVAFLGGGWSKKSYESEEPKPQHISRAALEGLYNQEFDILVCHEAPAGSRLPGYVYAVGAPPLRTLIENKQPRLVLHGHHHRHAENRFGETQVIALSRFYPGRSSQGSLLPLEL